VHTALLLRGDNSMRITASI